ncbi:tyrosine/serine/threonine protein phosphatase pps1 [Microbotryomycetes sp. JL201]|nr:tyrosine/serine/threonine protein phosphatase pps1 [Microbotryomycetes sp. JL201]
MAVAMHPTASRYGGTNGAAAFSTPFFPPVEALVSNDKEQSSRPSLTPTQSRFDAQQHRRAIGGSELTRSPTRAPVHGLTDLDASRYPTLSTVLGHSGSYTSQLDDIHVLTADEYARWARRHTRLTLPERELFPWSHGGADMPFTPASQYFGFATGRAAQTPRLVSSLALDTVVRTNDHGRTSFALPDNSSFETVNLRHFALQGAKYASVSDVVVYGEHGIDDGVVDAAIKIKEAQDAIFAQRGGDGVRYNVFVVADSFSTFETRHPRLVAIDSNGFVKNKLDFLEREREEMRVLTEAAEIAPNVWLGNGQDVPCAPFAYHYSSDSASSLSDDNANPLSLAICIEAHDTAAPLSLSTLAAADRTLTLLERTGMAFDEVRRLVEDDCDPTKLVEMHTDVLRPHVQDIVHLETPASISRAGSNGRARAQFINELVDTALWMRMQATPDMDSNKVPRRILLHCTDGYTETSLLALTYVMLVKRCSAPDAYLDLQQECGRSFFVYPADYKAMPLIEQRVRDVLEREAQEKRDARRGQWDDETEHGHPSVASSGMERSDSGYVSNDGNSSSSQRQSIMSAFFGRASSKKKTTGSDKVEVVQVDGCQNVTHERDALRDPFTEPELELSTAQSHPWFYADTFDGHFPSRILPYLYLGNLNHAMNAAMLKELGITHVVSVGESALHAPKAPSSFSSIGNALSISNVSAEQSSSQTGISSLWLEERLGNVSVLDMKNVADDGIDSIQPHFDSALQFIEHARWQGGRVLVHCRVGVSRSASIVIAYLIKHIELDLASAYLLTRSRRLNILIQPNLPFMAALHSFEADLLRQKRLRHRQSTSSSLNHIADHEVDDEEDDQYLGQAGLKESNRLTWNALATEISALNARFLLC